MKNNFSFNKYSLLNCMMIQLKEDGEKNTWEWIESISNPFKRLQNRQLFFMAKRKLNYK